MPIDESLAATLRSARRVAALTGAGVSAESGVQTFRGGGGLWCGHRIEDVATPRGFRRDPATVWEFYDERRVGLLSCAPNPGHHALAALERLTDDFTLITQNVDGLHRAAGSRNVLEIHGNIWTVRCTSDCGFETDDRRAPLPRPLPPRCACGGLLRPGVVWFEEMLPEEEFGRAVRAALGCEVFLVAGTSGVVEPAASLARTAKSAGAVVVEINPDATALSNVADYALRGPSGEMLPALLAARGDA